MVTIVGTSTKAQVVNVTGDLSTGGTLGVTGDAGDACTATSTLNVGGNLTAGRYYSYARTQASATLAPLNGATAQSVTAVINGTGAKSKES